MAHKRKKRGGAAQQASSGGQPIGDPNESGQPGGGKGRRDDVGRGDHGIFPASADPGIVPPDARAQGMMSFGQGKRGELGYHDSGGGGLIYRDGQVLGGVEVGPSGEPEIPIHGPDHLLEPGDGNDEPIPGQSPE